jgi:hypothetical protein
MEQTPSNSPIIESKPGPAGWLPVWIKAVTKPNEQTFAEITESPDAASRTAFIWIFIAGTVSGIIQAIATTVRMAMGLGSQFQQIPGMEQYFPQSAGDAGSAGVSLITGLCVSPIAGLISVLFFALFVAIIQWIAKLFGGMGTFDKLAYALAAISVPFTIVSSVLTLFSVIPYVGACFGLISFGLSLYALVLQVMAVKGVNRFGWGQAIGSVFIPLIVIFVVCGCVVIGGLTLLAPMIGNVFSEINQSLAP